MAKLEVRFIKSRHSCNFCDENAKYTLVIRDRRIMDICIHHFAELKLATMKLNWLESYPK